MRKGWIVLLGCALVVALAMPAAADVNLNGFYRARGYMSNFKAYAPGTTDPAFKDADPTAAFVEQRMRLRFSAGDENVKAVSFFELDQMWGDSANAVARNQGAGIGADSIQIETKNLFVWFKVPNTSVEATVGLQNQTDAYQGLFFGAADLAGIFVNAKLEPVTLRVAWSKWWENTVKEADDVDVYLVEAKLAPMKDFKLGVNLYFLNDRGADGNFSLASSASPAGASIIGASGLPSVEAMAGKIFMPGVDFSVAAGPATISGFAFLQTGKFKNDSPAVQDVKVNGYAADARADLALGPGKLFVEGIYISGNSGDDPTKYKSIITSDDYGLANSFFYRTDMNILLPNIDDINSLQALSINPNYGGRGMWHAAVGYNQKVMDKLAFKVGLGYLSVVKLHAADKAATGDRGKNIGTEVNANVNYNLQKGLDLGLYGAYAFLGDFYDKFGAETQDRSDPYEVHFRLNYAF